MSKILTYGLEVEPLVIEETDSATLVASAFSLHDGEPIVVQVDHVGSGVYRVTDQALAAGSLAIENVDLSKPSLSRSWKAIQASVHERFRHFGAQEEWEITAFAHGEDLGDAVNEVVAAVLRADGLSGMHRPRTSSRRLDRAVVQSAKAAGLVTLPNAPVPMKSGATRNVTARVSSMNESSLPALIQTFGPSKKGWEIPDLAAGLFGNMDEGFAGARVSVLGDAVELNRYQMAELRNVSDVVMEADLRGWMIGLAA